MKRQAFENIYFLAFSLAIGVLSAIGALFFRTLIELFQKLFWVSGATFSEQLMNSPWWLKIMAPLAGGLIAVPIITFFIPEAKGDGY